MHHAVFESAGSICGWVLLPDPNGEGLHYGRHWESRLTRACTMSAGCSPNVTLPAEPAGALAPKPDGPSTGTCNAYLRQSTTYARFLFAISFFARNGFYVTPPFPIS